MKKIHLTLRIAIAILFFVGFSFSNGNAGCQVSSNPENNLGHCQVEPYGTAELCYLSGEGPACSGSIDTDESGG